ncbi:MAG: CtsR family transcriptional regulator [Clostridia bacterium]|nr:CtsR family transcriptional regulator [Clostridia bacterium]
MISDVIEKMLIKMLTDEGGQLELRRNELAERLGCVPSQINYVITSRFTPERGYVIESRRGGGGYIRITKKMIHNDEYLMHLFCAVGDVIDRRSATLYVLELLERGLVTDREGRILSAVLSVIEDDETRANALKKAILAFAN